MSNSSAKSSGGGGKKKPSSFLAGFSFALWIAAAVALVLILRDAARFAPVFAGIDTDLPVLTAKCLELGGILSTSFGLAIAGAALVLSALPVVFGARGARAGKVYLVMAIAMVLAAGGAYAVTKLQIDKLQQRLSAAPGATR